MIKTNPVSGISVKGARFNAGILTLGTEKIIEHGFIWAEKDPDLESDRILLGPIDRTGEFSAEILSTLKSSCDYEVKAFVQTDDHIIFGNTVIFRSLGSAAPEIRGFLPAEASWNDTLTIKGKNFSWIPEENIVSLSGSDCHVIISTDTSIVIIVSTELKRPESVIRIGIAGHFSESVNAFRLKLPVVHDFSPKQVHWGDTITITGKNFYPDLNDSLVQVIASISGFKSEIIYRGNDTLLIKLPDELTTKTNPFEISYNTIKIKGISESITLLPPYISSIKPREGTWLSSLTLKGRFNPTQNRSTVKMQNYVAQILSTSRDSVVIRVPQLISSDSRIYYSSVPFTVISQDTFRLVGSVITSVNPLSGIPGTAVEIRGEFYGIYNNMTVNFGTQSARILNFSPSLILCQVPNGLQGPVKISVITKGIVSYFNTDFTVTNPYITSISPLTGTFDDIITINGGHLSSVNYPAYVNFYDNEGYNEHATVVSSSQSRLDLKIPRNFDSIPKIIHLNVGSTSIDYSEKFVLDPPEIISLSSSSLISGHSFTISGNNFNPEISRNKVLIGSLESVITSSTHNEITAIVPYMDHSFEKVKVIVGGYIRSTPDNIEIISPWSAVSTPFEWGSSNGLNQYGISFLVNGTAYIMDYFGEMRSFDPVTKTFSSLGNHPALASKAGASYAVNNDTLFLIQGNLGMMYYDSGLNSWVSVTAGPSILSNGVTFSLNGRIYTGLNYGSSLDKKMWVYDETDRSWDRVTDFPGYSLRYPVAHFTINNKGYILFTDDVFCEYDPVSDTWTRLSDYPGRGSDTYGRISFETGSKGYIGLGRETPFMGEAFNDIWEYEPSTDSWNMIGQLPSERGRYNAISFYINNKAYIGFGYYQDSKISGLLEFDSSVR